MNILLATSAAPDLSPFSTREKRPPLGIGFLIAVLRHAGHRVFFLDNFLKPTHFTETDYLQKHDIDFVGIYANTICYRDSLRMFRRLEELRQQGLWQGKIIVGGPHTTVAPDTIPEYVDFVVQGEGERAIVDIVEGRVADRIVRYPRIQNLDELPEVAWDYFVDLPYDFTAPGIPNKPVFTMNSSRGCPFGCGFCSVGGVWGRKYVYFSAQRVVADIAYLVNTYGARGIYFREDNFTVNRNRTIKICELLMERDFDVKWACETRVDTLDRELIQLMYAAGCRFLYLGVESGSQRVLDYLKKGITLEQSKRACQWCREIGMRTYASFIVGLPTETEAEREQTANFARELRADSVGMNVFVGLPGSELCQHVLDHNLYEYIDDRGLVYLKGHDQLVNRFYGGRISHKIPRRKLSKSILTMTDMHSRLISGFRHRVLRRW